MACKPGSVPLPARETRRSFLWTARRRAVLATYPGAWAGEARRPCGRRDAPIRSCSRRGLPCRPGCPVRGGLLPHPFTLPLLRRGFGGRFAFCGAIPGVAPGGRYPPPSHRGARTFLPSARGERATARPSDPAPRVGAWGAGVKARPIPRAFRSFDCLTRGVHSHAAAGRFWQVIGRFLTSPGRILAGRRQVFSGSRLFAGRPEAAFGRFRAGSRQVFSGQIGPAVRYDLR